jgi:ABC-type multidrug transport system fused ATPase/permease subunit
MSNIAGVEHGVGDNARLHLAFSSIWRYLALIHHLGRDLYRHFPQDTLRILVANAASLGCQILALAILFVYVGALEGNGALYGFASRTSMTLFAVVAISTVTLFFAFAWLEYRSNIAILALSRSYQNLGAQEALALASRLPHWFAAENGPQISSRHLRQILSIDVHHRSRMARILMRAAVPIVRLMISAAAIIYISPQFSVLILIIIGVPVAGLYWVGRRIADTISSREIATQQVYQEQARILSKSWKSGTHLLPEEIDWEATLGQPESRHRLYFKRLRAREFGKLLINTANTLGILVLVLSLGFWVINEQQGNWSSWLTYLVALRYFLSSLGRVAQSLVQSTRYNRQVRRFMDFVTAAKMAVKRADFPDVPCPESVVRAYQGDVIRVDEEEIEVEE